LDAKQQLDNAPVPYPHCYGCGSENAVGLHLEFEFDGTELRADFTPQDHHQGYPGIVHGGVIMSLLYEVMANIRRYSGDEAVLRRSTVEFQRPVPVGERLLVTARVVGETSQGWNLTAVLTDENDGRLDSATGEAVRPK
jgi:acyl-coenzyme A thioesterase PaaI-like protein